jgi:hypothetical protein
MQYVHSKGVIHRDIKESNIFLKYGKIKIGDFGLSKWLTKSNANETGWVGTYGYVSPEIEGGAKYSQMADIYSMGVVLKKL